MYKPDLCKLCGTCLVECPWMDIDRDQAIKWRKLMMAGKHSPVLDNCITCFSCNENCPQGANPCDQNLALQEKFGTLVSEDVIRSTEADYLFKGELKNVPKADRIMTTCSYEKSDPELIRGEIYDLPRVGGKPYLCWAIFSHMGAMSIQKNHLQSLIDRLSMTGAEEIICFHADCYSTLASVAPDFGIHVPFRPVHLAEYLVDYLRENKNRLRPLGFEIAYQRPCTARHTPDKEYFIDALFELVGVKRVERKYDRKKALCCTSVKLMYSKGNEKNDREKNVLDAKEAGAKAMAYFCPVCRNMLFDVASEHSLPLIFLGDLARAALGEIALPV